MIFEFIDNSMAIAYTCCILGFDYVDRLKLIKKAKGLRYPGDSVVLRLSKNGWSYPKIELVNDSDEGDRVYRFAALKNHSDSWQYSPTFIINEPFDDSITKSIIFFTDQKAQSTSICLDLLHDLINVEWKHVRKLPIAFENAWSGYRCLIYNEDSKVYLKGNKNGEFVFIAVSPFERKEYESYPFLVDLNEYYLEFPL